MSRDVLDKGIQRVRDNYAISVKRGSTTQAQMDERMARITPVERYEDIGDCDVVIALRLQNGRMSGALLPSSQEYFKRFGLTPERLRIAKPDAIVMHPGPMNRGVEIDSAVADGPHSVILPQVTFGIAVRMAVMSIIAGN